MSIINKWTHTAAGKVSVCLIVATIVFLFLAWSPLGESFLTIDKANFINNVLIGLATNLIGIVVTLSFVQYYLDKQRKKNEQIEENKKIIRYHKYMFSLIQRYLKFYTAITTRICDRNETDDISNAFTRTFKLSDMADMFQPSLYLTEGFSESSIELYYRAEHELKNYMLKMLENIDFKFNTELANLLLAFTIKSTDFDMSGQILEQARMQNYGTREEGADCIEKMIANEKEDWLGKFERGELRSNLILPYVILYNTCQEQVSMIKEYTELIKQIESAQQSSN